VTTISTTHAAEAENAPRRSRSGILKLAVALILAAGVGAAAYFGGVTTAKVKEFSGLASNKVKEAVRSLSKHEGEPESTPTPAIPPVPTKWDGLVKVTAEEQASIGFNTANVVAQEKPIKLELTGRTAYDPDTVVKIRPRFDTRVEQVFATLGQKIKKGDPLVRLYSTDLAASKSDFQTKYVQWQHDLKLYSLRQKLVETGAISQQLWVDTQNDEQKSRLDFNLALDKLTVFYEVPKEEIDPLLDKLGDKAVDPRQFGSVTDKAKMTLRSKTDGIVIEREVVPGNYYESTDVLMAIAPLDHLWVWANVYELDQDKVGVGQTMVIQFPFLQEEVEGQVNYVASQVSKETRAVRVRATIRNPEGRLKSDMLVKAMLEIPPVPGQTVIPRLSMVTIGGTEYVFVKEPESASTDTEEKKGADRFRRVKIAVAQENTDHVVVARGLTPGQVVVTNGSLILSQLYEDQRTIVTGLPEQ
jgi:cobalt-zinc-cadmium efflux system membrane fusion protein